jgi:hypothetical protein
MPKELDIEAHVRRDEFAAWLGWLKAPGVVAAISEQAATSPRGPHPAHFLRTELALDMVIELDVFLGLDVVGSEVVGRVLINLPISPVRLQMEGQHEQVPAYSMCIRTTFIVCIRRGEITGAISRRTLPYLRHRRATEPNVHPFRRFWSKAAGMQVNYKSAEKYIGDDAFELLVFFPAGFAWEVHLDVSVR